MGPDKSPLEIVRQLLDLADELDMSVEGTPLGIIGDLMEPQRSTVNAIRRDPTIVTQWAHREQASGEELPEAHLW